MVGISVSELLQFSEGFWGWMNILVDPRNRDYFFAPCPPAPRIVFRMDSSGEVAYFVESLPDGWVRVAESYRSSTPQFLYDFASMEGAEVYLCVECSDSVREKLGLVHKVPDDYLSLRDRVGMESGRFETRVIPWQYPVTGGEPLHMRVFSSGGKDYFRVGHSVDYTPPVGSWSRSAALTWYADKSLDEVLASLRDPSGAPLFELLGARRT